MKIDKRLRKGLRLAVALALLTPVAAQVAEAAGPTASGTLNQPNMAARALEQTSAMQERAAKGLSVSLANMYFTRSEVVVEGNEKMSEAHIRELLPELNKEEINLHKLSLQIMLANSSGGVQLETKLRPNNDGRFKVRVLVAEKKNEHVVESVTNSGNDYTGDWRMITSYVNSNLTGRADTLGVSYVTSPGHWDEVKQAAVSYRHLLPKAGGEMNFFAGWSDVDMGKVLNQDGPGYHMEMSAGGKSHNIGMNYIHHLSYSSKEKDSWEFGFEHKLYKNNWSYLFVSGGTPTSEAFKYDYAIDVLNVRFRHQEHSSNRFFGWNVGLTTNFTGDHQDFQRGTTGSDTRFTIFRGGTQYQYRTKSNWLLSGRLVGQYTDSKLISPEQLGAGGMYSLRGFNERTANADRGLVGSVEVYTPELLPKLRGLIFTDFASLHNNNPSARWRHEGASTAGLGLRWTDKDNGLYVSLDYVAKIMNDINKEAKSQSGNKRWNLVLTKVF